MEQCSICLDEVATSVPALACGHRFHAACLARFAGAVGTPSSTSRRGILAACPNCRTVSRVSIVAPVETHSVGDRVSALWGHQWFPGVIDEVVDGDRAYEVAWDDGYCNKTSAMDVRAAAQGPVSPAALPPPPVVATPPEAPAAPRRRPVVPAEAPAVAPEEDPAAPSSPAPKLMRCGKCRICRARRDHRRCRAPVPFVLAKKSRFTGVYWGRKQWRATISVLGSTKDPRLFRRRGGRRARPRRRSGEV